MLQDDSELWVVPAALRLGILAMVRSAWDPDPAQQGMAGQATPFPRSLHTHGQLLAQHGGSLVRDSQLPLHQGTRDSHQELPEGKENPRRPMRSCSRWLAYAADLLTDLRAFHVSAQALSVSDGSTRSDTDTRALTLATESSPTPFRYCQEGEGSSISVWMRRLRRFRDEHVWIGLAGHAVRPVGG